MAELNWRQRYGEAIVCGLIVAAILSVVTIVASYDAPHLRTVAYVIGCGGMALLCCVAVLILRRYPKRRIIPNDKNIEDCVREWLDNHRIAVTKDPSSPTYFRYRITIPVDGEMMTVLRMKDEHPEYVQVLADLGLRGDLQQQFVQLFSPQEINQLMFDMKLELARSKVGYSGLVMPPDNFMIFKKVPIHPGLTEVEFMTAVFEVEAAMHIVALMFLKARQNKDDSQAPPAPMPTPPPPPTSGTPIPELPEGA